MGQWFRGGFETQGLEIRISPLHFNFFSLQKQEIIEAQLGQEPSPSKLPSDTFATVEYFHIGSLFLYRNGCSEVKT